MEGIYPTPGKLFPIIISLTKPPEVLTIKHSLRWSADNYLVIASGSGSSPPNPILLPFLVTHYVLTMQMLIWCLPLPSSPPPPMTNISLPCKCLPLSILRWSAGDCLIASGPGLSLTLSFLLSLFFTFPLPLPPSPSLNNPCLPCRCLPLSALRWSAGDCLMASGSGDPFCRGLPSTCSWRRLLAFFSFFSLFWIIAVQILENEMSNLWLWILKLLLFNKKILWEIEEDMPFKSTCLLTLGFNLENLHIAELVLFGVEGGGVLDRCPQPGPLLWPWCRDVLWHMNLVLNGTTNW